MAVSIMDAEQNRRKESVTILVEKSNELSNETEAKKDGMNEGDSRSPKHSSLIKSTSTPSTAFASVNTGSTSSPVSGKWKVILHEDDVNSLGYAEYSLVEVIKSMDSATAQKIRNEAIRHKKSVVLSAEQNEAEKILYDLQMQGLTVSLEPEVLAYSPDAYDFSSHLKTPKDVINVTLNDDSDDNVNRPKLVEIEDEAFMECNNLRKVNIDCKYLKRIGRDAFRECTSLTSIIIPEGVTEIGPYAFTGCFSLTSVVLPSTLTKIGRHAFRRCTSLTTIHIHNTKLTSIETSTFESCVSLPTMFMPQGIKSIGRFAFRDCYSLASVSLPSTLTHVNSSAFEKCSSLVSIQLPPSITNVKKDAFNDCPQFLSKKEKSSATSDPINNLKSRFNDLPLHELCYDPQINLAKLESFLNDPKIESERASIVQSIDKLHCTALHILVSNPNVTFDVLELLIEQYPQATSIPNLLGMLPIQQACYNTHAPHEIYDILGKHYRLDLNSHSVVDWNDVDVDLSSNIDSITDNQPHVEMPLLLASRFNLHENVTQILFALHPIAMVKQRRIHSYYRRRNSMCMHDTTSTSRKSVAEEDDEQDETSSLYKLAMVEEKYQKRMFQALHEWTETSTMSDIMEYGLVMYLTNLEGQESVKKWQQFLEDSLRCSFEGIQFLSRLTLDREEEEEEEEPLENEVKEVAELKKKHSWTNLRAQLILDIVDPKIKAAVKKRLSFLGRYEIDKGTPFLHKSDNCVVIEAIDNGMSEYYKDIFKQYSDASNNMNSDQLNNACHAMNISKDEDPLLFGNLFRSLESSFKQTISEEEFTSFCLEKLRSKVALKFIKNEENYNREMESNRKLNSIYIIKIIRGHKLNMEGKVHHITTFLGSLSSQLEDPHQFQYCLVMPLCHRNLDTIVQCEQPNYRTVRTYMRQIAEGLQYLHEEAGLVHGDIKSSNIVRYMNRMCLLDLSASVKISEEGGIPSYVGEKFSSVMLPPEMIYSLKRNSTEEKKYRSYFGKHLNDKNDVKWTTSKTEKKGFVVKTFYSEKEERTASEELNPVRKINEGALPYSLVEASPSIDIWAFGCILYKMCTTHSLFSADINQNIIDGDEIEVLYNWNTLMKYRKLEKIHDIHAWDLLNQIFLENPSKRPQTMREILSHSYFTTIESKDDNYTENEKKLKEYKEKNVHSMINSEVRYDLENSSTKMFQTFFERADVDTPTCFCIVPIVRNEKSTERLDFLKTIIEFIDEISKEPLDKPILEIATNLFATYCKKGFRLYLLDEWTVDSVIYQYPLRVKLTCEQLCKFLPVMIVGWKNKIKPNRGIGIAHIFNPEVPFEEMKDTKRVVSCLVDQFVNSLVSRGGLASDRDTSLHDGLNEFSIFLSNKDKGELYGGLVRIINCGTGDSMWVSHESKDAMNKIMPIKSLDPQVREVIKDDIRKSMTEAERKKEEWVNQKVGNLMNMQLCVPWNASLDFTTF